jgi:hypothetical protein
MFYYSKTLLCASEITNAGRGAIMYQKSSTPNACLFGYGYLYGRQKDIGKLQTQLQLALLARMWE